MERTHQDSTTVQAFRGRFGLLVDEPILRARDVTCCVGDGENRLTILQSVTLDLYRGQLVLLVGPSGSGKSTLIAALSGLTRPVEGSVEVFGQDLWRMSEAEREALRRQEFGFVFQGYNLFPALTVRQQLELVLRWGEGLSPKEATVRALAALASLGMQAKAELRPGQLSGGEKQRVALGRALVKRSSLLFADEPTSALDWRQGKAVIETLRSAAHKGGSSVLVVSHDPRLMPYADAILRLDDGQLVDWVDSARAS